MLIDKNFAIRQEILLIDKNIAMRQYIAFAYTQKTSYMDNFLEREKSKFNFFLYKYMKFE